MLGYEVVKWVHILSAAVLFATGLGTALHLWLAHRRGNVQAIAAAARNVVRIDLALTAASLLGLPITGAILVWMLGFAPGAPWLVASYILFAIAFACWVAATWLRIRVRDTAAAAAGKGEALPDRYYLYMRWWFQLSWPALVALLVAVYLMTAQPQAGAVWAGGRPPL